MACATLRYQTVSLRQPNLQYKHLRKMNLQKLQPRESLNKAFLKVKPNRNDIEHFKKNLQSLIEKINESESEEFHKNLIGDFLKNTYYSTNHFINTKGRNDFVIHNGKDAKSSVGVILEAKKPTNKGEMLKVDNLNTKAFQELVLYFLRERLIEKNIEVKYLIVTNIYEWFIFDANSFDKAFIENKTLVKQFTYFAEGRLTSKKTDFFYKEIAQPAIAEIQEQIPFTYFDIREYQEYLQPGENPHDHKLIPLFKLFSPSHLLKLPFANDSNTLDKGFYSELLHIIGLTETKEGGKKLIQRKKENERNPGSLIENAIVQLDSLDKISRIEKPERFGEIYQEQIFNVGLELAITWVNRILFLKLLEAQLIKYHKNDPSLGFLNLQKVQNYHDLNSLFFNVLARKQEERTESVKKIFSHVPYLNSSLFEPAVVQKFNEVKGWNCENIDDLYEKIEDKKEANRIINSLKICDPAVGSGHFLVSALNEIIAIKSELKILLDREGKRLKEYDIEVVNDELIVIDDEKLLFEYNPKSKESQRVQETLFHEKQTIIENCLFGVDINPNSVKICQLRLWIELLKNAYYKTESNYTELETLPNIDINIKEGNSLISRFGVDTDLKSILISKKSQSDIKTYKAAIRDYFNAKNKDDKKKAKQEIDKIEKTFNDSLKEIGSKPKKTKLDKLEAELYSLNYQQELELFEETKSEKKTREKKIAKLNNEIDKLRVEIEDIEGGKIYKNALEWRFEFPEVLNDDGDFIGFDVVIGNPPYIRQEEIKNQKPYLQTNFITYSGTADLYVFFVEQGFKILKAKGQFCYIMPNKWMQAGYGKALRSYILENQLQEIIDFGDVQIFEEATTYPCIINASKQSNNSNFISAAVKTLNYSNGFPAYLQSISNQITVETLNDETWVISSDSDQKLLSRIKNNCVSLAEYINGEAHYGIKTGLTEAFLVNVDEKDRMVIKDPKSWELLKPVLRGRTIKKWYAEQDNLWLIGTFPVLNVNIDNYPAIRDYLLRFDKKRLEQSGEEGSRKKTSGEWFETQDNIAYYQEFEKPKIMYQKFQVKPCFIYDDQGLYCNDSMWIISKADKVLLAILNSKVGWWLISKYCTAIQNGFQLIWKYFGQIPIPQANQKQGKLITSLVDQILTAKKSDPKADTTALETEIDQLVYQLYELTAEEIKIIEG